MIAGNAAAADVTYEATGFSWAGGYVGVFGGIAHSRTKVTDVTGEEFGPPLSTLSMSDTGFVGGVTAGYNFQNGNWVWGPELEMGWASNDRTYVNPNDDEEGILTKYGLFGTATARVGYAMDRTLFYGKAGVAFARIRNAGGEYDGVGDEDSGGKWGFDGNESGFGDETRVGLTIGAGVEHALTNQWTVKGEYMYADFGTKTYGHANGNMSLPYDFRNHLHTVKIGFNYRF